MYPTRPEWRWRDSPCVRHAEIEWEWYVLERSGCPSQPSWTSWAAASRPMPSSALKIATPVRVMPIAPRLVHVGLPTFGLAGSERLTDRLAIEFGLRS